MSNIVEKQEYWMRFGNHMLEFVPFNEGVPAEEFLHIMASLFPNCGTPGLAGETCNRWEGM